MVEGTWDMTPKSGDNPLRKHQQSTEKEERNEGDSDSQFFKKWKRQQFTFAILALSAGK